MPDGVDRSGERAAAADRTDIERRVEEGVARAIEAQQSQRINQVIIGVLVGAILAAAGGAWSMGERLTRLETSVMQMTKQLGDLRDNVRAAKLDALEARVKALERTVERKSKGRSGD